MLQKTDYLETLPFGKGAAAAGCLRFFGDEPITIVGFIVAIKYI